MRPYFQRGEIRLYLGDCREVLPLLPAGSEHVTLTDAPYNGDLIYGDGTDDSRPWPEYVTWLAGVLGECERVSRGPVLCFVSKPGLIALAAFKPPWWVGQWVNTGAGNPSGPNRGLMFMPFNEPCLFYGNRNGLKACIPDSWACRVETRRNGHPCPKPLPLMQTLLGLLRPDSVLDPFSGSGTTLVAAQAMGIPAIGIEIEERYCEIAAKRLAQVPLPFNAPRAAGG